MKEAKMSSEKEAKLKALQLTRQHIINQLNYKKYE